MKIPKFTQPELPEIPPKNSVVPLCKPMSNPPEVLTPLQEKNCVVPLKTTQMIPPLTAPSTTPEKCVVATQTTAMTIMDATANLALTNATAETSAFAALPEGVRAEARERLKFLQYCMEHKRLAPKTPDQMIVNAVALTRIEEFPILRTSGQHGASQLTYNNFRNWRRRLLEYRNTPGAQPGEGDLLALASSYKRGDSLYKTADGIPAIGDRQFWCDFSAAYLNQNKLNVTVAREVAAFAARKRNPAAVIPSIAQVRSYVRSLPLGTLIAGREGEVAWRNTISDYVSRDWNCTEPGELLIGDSRDFDTRVRHEVEPGKWVAVRPSIACLMDARSWMPAGWTITVNPVNSDVLMRTLLDYICRTNGQVPAMCYFDNGKDYCKQGFSTPLKVGKYEHSIFKELGITLTNARPFNARAKTVERFFRDMMKTFDKFFPDYLGSNPLERPDAASYFDKKENVMELPTLESFVQIFTDWLKSYVSRPKGGTIHQGKSPAEIWNLRNPDVRKFTPQQIALAFLLPVGIRQVSRGPAVLYQGRRYFSDEVRVGEKVLIKANPFDPEMVMLCQEDGAIIGIARTRRAVHAITGDDTVQRQLLNEQLARQNKQRREMVSQLQTLTGGLHGASAIELLLSIGTDSQFIKRGSMRTIKGKSHDYKRIAPSTDVFDVPADEELEAADIQCGTTQSHTGKTCGTTQFDLPDDEPDIRNFHNFMLNNNQGEEDYE